GRSGVVSEARGDRMVLVQRLRAARLAAWRVAGRVEREADRVTLTAGDDILVVARGTPPFRWTVTLAARERGVTSVAGLLRLVRRGVDPGHPPSRLRIGPPPLVPPCSRCACSRGFSAAARPRCSDGCSRARRLPAPP